jgi:hypothetical protein
VFGLARSLGLVPTVTQIDTRRPVLPASDSVVVQMERAS